MRVGCLVAAAVIGAAGFESAVAQPRAGSAQERVARWFAQLDRDGDRLLSADEFPQRVPIDRVDRDGDGKASVAEIMMWLGSRRGAGAGETPTVDGKPVRAERDIVYRDEPDDADKQTLDVYWLEPEPEDQPRPLLVMIHGGGWANGDKAGGAMTRDKVPYFVGEGFVYASVNYRLSPEVRHPAHVDDVAAAIAWLSRNAERFGADQEGIFVMGHSAGAHLAALVCTDERRINAYDERGLSLFAGAIVLDTAAYDVPRLINEIGTGASSIYKTAFGPEQGWADASPRSHVRSGIDTPPMILFHSGRRRDAAALSREFAEALREAGAAAATVHAPDRDHAQINACIGVADDPYTRLVRDFLRDPERVSEIVSRFDRDR